MYISKWLVTKKFNVLFTINWDPPDIPAFGASVSETQAEQAESICGLVDIGDQFLMLLVVDLFVRRNSMNELTLKVSNAIEIGYPIIEPLIFRIILRRKLKQGETARDKRVCSTVT